MAHLYVNFLKFFKGIVSLVYIQGLFCMPSPAISLAAVPEPCRPQWQWLQPQHPVVTCLECDSG